MTALPAPSEEIPPLGRFEFYSGLGLISVMEPESEVLFREIAMAELLDAFDSPHKHAWHVSNHASEFPGDPETVCHRYAVYRLANVPADKPMDPWVSGTGEVGKAGELWYANAWFKGGRLLAIPENPARPELHQLGFESPAEWLTGSTDLPILPFGWTRPHIVEIKCKADDVLKQMLEGEPDPSTGVLKFRQQDKKHELQLKATLGLAHEYDWGEVTVDKDSWRILRSDIHERLGLPGGRLIPEDQLRQMVEDGLAYTFKLDPPTTGEVFYWSRSWPRTTKSFFFGYDPAYIAAGRKVLSEVKAFFEADVLPEKNPGYKYSYEPCKWCNFSATCRKDAGLEPRKRKPTLPVTERISQSHAVARAVDVRGEGYNYAQTRAAVFARWSEVDPLADLFPYTPDVVEEYILKKEPVPDLFPKQAVTPNNAFVLAAPLKP